MLTSKVDFRAKKIYIIIRESIHQENNKGSKYVCTNQYSFKDTKQKLIE